MALAAYPRALALWPSVGPAVYTEEVKIRYTKHAARKFADLQELDVRVTKSMIRAVITHPYHLDTLSDQPKIIASGILDSHHILRVVYRQQGDIIMIITFYPARSGRYFV